MTAPLTCTLTMREIIDITAQNFDLSVTDITSRHQHAEIIAARQAASWLIRELIPRSYAAIARALGGRDHTTIINAVAGCEARMASDPRYAALVTAVKSYCLSARSLAPPETDPFDAAKRILSSPRAATGVSLETIRDLAGIAVSALEEATRQEVEAAQGLAEREANATARASAEVEQLRVALKTANDEITRLSSQAMPLKTELEAFIAAEHRLSICSAAGERAAREHAEKARAALARAANSYFNLKRTVK